MLLQTSLLVGLKMACVNPYSIVCFALTGRVRLLASKTERQGRVAGALSAGTRPHVPRLDARPLDKR